MNAADVMNTPIVAATTKASAREIARYMLLGGCSGGPIRESGRKSAGRVPAGVCPLGTQSSPACASIRAEGRSRRWGLARTSPGVFQLRAQRIALDTLTPKRAAACRREAPASTASTTRTRRSSERLFPIHTGLLHSSQHVESEIDRFGNPLRFNQFGKRSRCRFKVASEVSPMSGFGYKRT